MSDTLEKLREYGADIDGAMDRFLNDEELYKDCMVVFLNDKCFETLGESIIKKEYDNAFDAAHTLKGVAGNMGLTPIYKLICNAVENLRQKSFQDLEEIYSKIIAEHNKIEAICKQK